MSWATHLWINRHLVVRNEAGRYEVFIGAPFADYLRRAPVDYPSFEAARRIYDNAELALALPWNAEVRDCPRHIAVPTPDFSRAVVYQDTPDGLVKLGEYDPAQVRDTFPNAMPIPALWDAPILDAD